MTIKNILSRIFKIVFLLLLLYFIGISWFEHSHHLQGYNDYIGESLSDNRTDYNASNRKNHIGYLETFEYQSYSIRYIDRGHLAGPTIVLLHGTPTNSWLWRKMIPGLIDKGYRVIAPDMLGFGASSMPTSSDDLSIENQSTLLLSLLDSLDVSTFAITAHDQGSLRMRETVTKNHDRISHMIILNSIGERSGFHPPAGFGRETIATRFVSWAMGSKTLGRLFAYGALLGGLEQKSKATPTMVNGYLFPLLNDMNKTYHAFITDFDTIKKKLEGYHEIFPTLDIPTTIIRGEHDSILVGEQQIPVLKELLGIQEDDIFILNNSSHFIQEESPKEILDHISQFIK